MFDKISFNNIENKKANMDKNINKRAYAYNTQSSDEFVKSKKEVDDEHTFTKDDIANILSGYNLNVIADNLIQNNYSGCGCTIVLNSANNIPRVFMGVENYDTMETEQYSFSYKEFAQIINDMKDKQIKRYPERKEQLENQYQKILEKLKQDDNNI